jgi:hypothetical protein
MQAPKVAVYGCGWSFLPIRICMSRNDIGCKVSITLHPFAPIYQFNRRIAEPLNRSRYSNDVPTEYQTSSIQSWRHVSALACNCLRVRSRLYNAYLLTIFEPYHFVLLLGKFCVINTTLNSMFGFVITDLLKLILSGNNCFNLNRLQYVCVTTYKL